jgi:hypothetical protein
MIIGEKREPRAMAFTCRRRTIDLEMQALLKKLSIRLRKQTTGPRFVARTTSCLINHRLM